MPECLQIHSVPTLTRMAFNIVAEKKLSNAEEKKLTSNNVYLTIQGSLRNPIRLCVIKELSQIRTFLDLLLLKKVHHNCIAAWGTEEDLQDFFSRCAPQFQKMPTAESRAAEDAFQAAIFAGNFLNTRWLIKNKTFTPTYLLGECLWHRVVSADKPVFIDNMVQEKHPDLGKEKINSVFTILGETPLLYAIKECSNPKTIETLINHGADPNIANNTDGNTPLHYTLKYTKLDFMERLLEKDVNINALNNQKETALLYVLQWRPLLGIKCNILVNRSIDTATEIESLEIQKSFTNIEKGLLGEGEDRSPIREDGKTVLHHAVEQRLLPMIKILIEKGIDLTVLDSNGKTALQLAEEQGFTEIAKLLTSAKIEKAEETKISYQT